MNSGKSYIVSENIWGDKPQSVGSLIFRSIGAIVGIVLYLLIILSVGFGTGAVLFMIFAMAVGAQFAPLAFTIGGFAFLACVLIGIHFLIEFWHNINNWIHAREDVLVID